VELAPEKRQLLPQQHDEGAALVAALDQLQAEYQQELEQIRRQTQLASSLLFSITTFWIESLLITQW